MKLDQFSFGFKIVFSIFFGLCIVYNFSIKVMANGTNDGNYYNLNKGFFGSLLFNKNYYYYPQEHGSDDSIYNDRFARDPYTILYSHSNFYKHNYFNPKDIYIQNVIKNSNGFSYEIYMPKIQSRYSYIDTRIKASGSISQFLNSNIQYSGINTTDNLYIFPISSADSSYANSYSVGNKLNTHNYFYKNDFYISNFYLNDISSNNFNIKINLDNNYTKKFISNDSKIYTYVIFNTLDYKIAGGTPVFEALRILDYNDMNGNKHNASVLENKQKQTTNDLKNTLLDLQNQVNNNSQYDSETKDSFNHKLDNIMHYNEVNINHIVNQTNYKKNYNESILTDIDDIKSKTARDMNNYLNRKVLSIEYAPDLNFGKKNISYIHNTIAKLQNHTYFQIKSFNNSNWRMNLSVSDMTDGKDSISSKYFQGNNSSYNNKTKTFNFYGNDGVKYISLNNLYIKIPNNVRLHSGNYRGTATWNLVNGPK
ncbi:hypothetical protein [Apilactobacillus timberlakei]|uniref:WxL domain-containing protein n=1 Tax=Apilactobacillus timberlakei TaxID=2008380 RepID=A0ABY2Z068_9LACO|nr:hypothetical protein [Apilactobacillus timberlakei]TPR12932.1 hypothetical protein DY052_08830 [Apilactobacillus timberlakei]TPR14903.1 hypothetical protein DYZ97_01850 [Apilactobacillus timberlakei]TPR16234.1 hypothetical protein DY048_01865 [Apilactobacillus timberlakei]